MTGTLMFDCKKQTTTPAVPTVPPVAIIPAGISGVIDSDKWVATNCTAGLDTEIYDTIVFLDINGYDISIPSANGGTLLITIAYYKNITGSYNIHTGSYNIGTGSYNLGYTSSVLYNYYWGSEDATSGTITLTKISTDSIQGTFNCWLAVNGVGNSNITSSGQFNVHLQ